MEKRPTYDVVSNPFLPEKGEEDDLYILFAGHSQTKPGHQNGPRVFDYYLIHVVLSGRGTFECDGERFHLAAGDSFVIEPGKLVTYRADPQDPWFYRWIAVKGARAGQLLTRCGIDWAKPVVCGCGPELPPARTEGGKSWGAAGVEVRAGRRKTAAENGHAADEAGCPAGDERLLPACWIERTEETFRAREPGGALEATGCFHMLLAGFAAVLKPNRSREVRGLTRIERHMRQAAERLTAQFAEPIRIDRLAEQFGYSRSYFSKMFKKVNRVTPVEFLTSLRTGKARQMLRERPDLSVEQIACSVGYQDALYFSKQFRKVYGLSPSEYRKSVLRSAGDGKD
jgi:AraC-like DNA-binding protein